MKKVFSTRSIALLSIVSIILIVAAGCKKNTDVAPIVYGNAKIRVVNTVQGSSAQDFYQGDNKLTTSALAYDQFSPYLTVTAGNSTLSFKNSGSTTASASANVGLYTDASYTVFYYSNSSGSGQITGFQDDVNVPVSGKSKVRFVNLGSALSNNINIIITGGAALINGLAYGYSSGYTSVDANTSLTASVLNSTTVTNIPGSTFQTGKIYTIWFDAANNTTVNYHVVQQN